MATKEALHLDVGMTIQQVLYMNAGVGDKSYANNSLLQKKVMLKARPILEEGLTRLYCSIVPECLKVADLGCSSGPNALQLVYDIINIIDITSCNLNLRLPVFQFCLNDLFGNDFNTIFKSLPEFFETLEKAKGQEFGPCFINATPGNYYKRLFPNHSIHFFHSSYSLHWLSQAPKGLDNKDNIYLTRTSPAAVHKAYVGQFQDDFKLFLKLRSEELVPGGGMVLTFIGIERTSEKITPWELIGMILNEMLLENLIEKIKLESFNFPIYYPTREEAKQVIEEEGFFTLHRLETMTMGWDGNINEGNDNKVDEDMRGDLIAKCIRAVSEPTLKAQFGEGIMDELFLRFKDKVVQLIMEKESLQFFNLVISLIKNDRCTSSYDTGEEINK